MAYAAEALASEWVQVLDLCLGVALVNDFAMLMEKMEDIRFLNRECASYTAADDHAHQDKFEENEQDPEVATRQAEDPMPWSFLFLNSMLMVLSESLSRGGQGMRSLVRVVLIQRCYGRDLIVRVLLARIVIKSDLGCVGHIENE